MTHLSARFFDGQTAKAHDVTFLLTGEGLVIVKGAGKIVWQAEGLSVISKKPFKIGHADYPDARLILSEESATLLREEKPDWMKCRLPAGWFKIPLFCLCLFAAGWLALPGIVKVGHSLIPPEMEDKIGKRMARAIAYSATKMTHGPKESAAFCNDQKGLAVLEKITAQFAKASDLPVKILIVKTDKVNAFATLGSYILIFDGLLQKAPSGDALAGFIAHEIGHLHYKHPIDGFLHQKGLRFLLQSVGLESSLSRELLHQILSANRNHESEFEADLFSMSLLEKMQIPSGAFHSLLAGVLKGSNNALPTLLSTHPLDAERLDRMRPHIIKDGASMISGSDFATLKKICKTSNREMP